MNEKLFKKFSYQEGLREDSEKMKGLVDEIVSQANHLNKNSIDFLIMDKDGIKEMAEKGHDVAKEVIEFEEKIKERAGEMGLDKEELKELRKKVLEKLGEKKTEN